METPASLLERLRAAPDADAWRRLVQLYTPLLFNWLRRHQCGTDESADLIQDVFLALVETLPGFAYDRQKSFRRWLRTVALNKLRDRIKKKREATLPDADDWQSLADRLEADPFWEAEYRAQLVRRALEIMQRDFAQPTWLACWQVVVEERPAKDVARELGLTIGAVHAARFRVLERLRQELAGLLE